MSSNKNLQNIFGTISWSTSTLTSPVHFISYVHATDAQDNQSLPIFSPFNYWHWSANYTLSSCPQYGYIDHKIIMVITTQRDVYIVEVATLLDKQS